MDQQIPLDLTTVAPLRARIRQWREMRTHRGAPMPAALWAAAVDVARRHGLAATARALGVDYGTLKRRLAATEPGPPAAAPTFVDLGVTAPLGLGASVIAVDGPRGRRLRLEVSDLRVPDLLALVHAAWGHEG
jgi:hypothetical protein